MVIAVTVNQIEFKYVLKKRAIHKYGKEHFSIHLIEEIPISS